jgi:hypothetical protein
MSVSFKFGDVVALKLSTSEEVIARFESETEETILLNKPMSFMMGPNGVGLVPFFFSAPKDFKVTISKANIIGMMITPDENVAKQYQRQTSSLIV